MCGNRCSDNHRARFKSIISPFHSVPFRSYNFSIQRNDQTPPPASTPPDDPQPLSLPLLAPPLARPRRTNRHRRQRRQLRNRGLVMNDLLLATRPLVFIIPTQPHRFSISPPSPRHVPLTCVPLILSQTSGIASKLTGPCPPSSLCTSAQPPHGTEDVTVSVEA